MNEYLFNKKVESLIKNSINHHLRYEEIHKSMYNIYEEYENPNTTKVKVNIAVYAGGSFDSISLTAYQ